MFVVYEEITYNFRSNDSLPTIVWRVTSRNSQFTFTQGSTIGTFITLDLGIGKCNDGTKDGENEQLLEHVWSTFLLNSEIKKQR